MMVEFVLLILLAYLIGSVPSAYLAGKWFRGVDIREHGSGNVGVSNLISATSWQTGLPAIIFDIVKGILPIWVAYQLQLGIPQQVTVGTAAIVGHNWPVLLRFNGGRGMLTTLAVVFALPVVNGYIPWELLAFFACAVVCLFTIHNIPIGTAAGIGIAPVVSWLTGKPLALTLGFMAIFLILIIRRLTAPLTEESANVSMKQLIVNRLFLDRDIRDREAWINRQSTKQISVEEMPKKPHPG
jgi:glycerol-3-phosphate acyltransferase PlsY